MEQKETKLFSLMVVGENPDELLQKYDKNLKVETYVKYHYKDASQLKKGAIKLMQDIIDKSSETTLSDVMVDYLKERIKIIKKMSDFEYYTLITEGLNYNENGDAETDVNPNGKWSTCRIGRNLCIPLELKNGDITFQAKAGDVNWGKLHMFNEELYSTTWKLFHKEKEPSNEQEKQIYENIKHQKRYFAGFECEEDYVDYNCSYWNYAYLDKNGWVDADDYKNYEWITEFFDKYVKTLKDDDLVTIYECTK